MGSEAEIGALQEMISDLLLDHFRLLEKLASVQEALQRFELTNQMTGNSLETVFKKPQNPLLVDVIVQHVGRYLNHKSLATGRQVCLKWNAYMTPEWASRSEMFLNFSSYKLDKIDKFSKELLSVFPVPLAKPDVNSDIFVAIPWTLSIGINPQKLQRGTQLLLQWLQAFGPEVRDLELFSENESIPVDLLNDVVSKCPNLKSFRFPCPFLQGPFPQNPIRYPRIENLAMMFEGKNHYLESPELTRETMDASVGYLLNLTPRLKSLTLDIFYGRSILNNSYVYIENITELSLRNHFDDEYLSLLLPLSDVGFKSVKKLTLESGKHSFPRNWADKARFLQLLNKFLTNISPTLTHLSLDLNLGPSPFHSFNDDEDIMEEPLVNRSGLSYIPQMLNLKILEFKSELESGEESIDFLQKFPNLETLVLSSVATPDVLFRLFPNDLQFQHGSLRTLKLPEMAIVDRPIPQQVDDDDSSDDEDVEEPIPTLSIINACFPSLEVLSILLRSQPGFLNPVFEKHLILLNEYPCLTDLSISIGNTKSYDFNISMYQMFVCKRLGFSGLKRLSFHCRREAVSLSPRTFDSFQNASSLQYLELRNFLLESDKPDAFYKAIGRLNRVRLVNCRRTGVFLGARTKCRDIYDDEWDFEQELGTSSGISGQLNC